MDSFQEHKIVQVLAYLSVNKQITNRKAYKLFWLADRYHLLKYARTISGDTYYAMEKGPIPSMTKKMIDGIECSTYLHDCLDIGKEKTITVKKEPDYSYLSISDKEVLDIILKTYGNCEDEELSELSHKSPEWKNYESVIKGKKKTHRIAFKYFFSDFADEKHLFSSIDYSLSKELFFGKEI